MKIPRNVVMEHVGKGWANPQFPNFTMTWEEVHGWVEMESAPKGYGAWA